MRKITILVLLMAMLTSVVFGLSTMASAEAEPIKVKVTAYNMQNSASFPWQANAEDEYCVFTGATNLNTGETNDVIVEFTAPAAGTINIANNWTFCANTSGAGDGARVRLIHNDVQLYPTDARWAEIPVDNPTYLLTWERLPLSRATKFIWYLTTAVISAMRVTLYTIASALLLTVIGLALTIDGTQLQRKALLPLPSRV